MIDVLLLLALPASGKSEIRRYLASMDPEESLETLGIGSTVQLDDFPYVNLMRRISDEAVERGLAPPFFSTLDSTFVEKRDWATLIHLVNEDYEYLTNPPVLDGGAGEWIASRLVGARAKAGADPYFPSLSKSDRRFLEDAIEREARDLFDEISARRQRPGQTVVIEFARGGPTGASCPLPPPLGYRFALSLLSPAILSRATALYVHVTPEQSRKKNLERAVVGEEGSILHHGVPESVMLDEYGMDDFTWMMESAEQPGTVDILVGERYYSIPATVFDNRADLTSFLRAEPETWNPGDLDALRDELSTGFARFRE